MFRIIVALICVLFGAGTGYAVPSELDKIQTQIRQTEQKHKQLTEQVKTSDRDVEKTKKQLVSAADKVSSLEEMRAEIAKKIAELDAARAVISRELEQNRVRVADAAAAVLVVAAHPSFDTENMHDFVLRSAVMAGMSDNLDAAI